MKILIYGATGATGQELVKQALALGHHVTAYVRNPQKLVITSPQLTVVRGELYDKQLINQIVAGQDAVLSALGASSMFSYDTTVVAGIETIIRAMEAHQVNRLIYESFAGVRESRSRAGFIVHRVAPKILSTEIDRHEHSETLIMRSKLDWTIVRPPTLNNNKPAGSYRTGENISSNKFLASISRADVADFMIRQLTDKEYIRKAPLILA